MSRGQATSAEVGTAPIRRNLRHRGRCHGGSACLKKTPAEAGVDISFN
jgi:hypothetical protein